MTERDATKLFRSFLDVGLVLAEERDVHAVLQVVVERAAELTRAEMAAAATVSPDGSIEERISQATELPGEHDALFKQIVEGARPLRLDAVPNDPREARPFLGVPLQHRGLVVGALYLTKAPGEEPFTEEDELLLTALGASAGGAIENARLLEIEQQRAERGDLLNEIARKVRHSLEVRQVLSEAVESLGRAAGAMRCYVRLTDPPGAPTLGPIEAEWDAPGVAPLDPAPSKQYAVATITARARRTQWTEDASVDPRFTSPEMESARRAMLDAGARAGLGTPLEWGDELMGVIIFQSETPRRWMAADRALIEAVAREVSVALHHARLYDRAVEQAQRLEDLDRLRRDFVSMVSHELRSPMTVVAGIAHILRWRGDRLSDDARDELLETLERESRRLTRLVSEFLDLEAIERGHIALQLAEVDLADLAAEAMVDAGQAARTSLHIEGENAIVSADRDRVKQVMLNLIGNAVKFSDEDAPIEIEVTCLPESVEFAVRDHGPGISEPDMQQLFERFTRLKTTVDRTPGSGIGLFVSKHIVDMHGGDIRVESVPDEGATFSVKLPRRQPDA
ncbi:MAG TPA: ATP-binding protein [Actinomycetota bacterium]|nr:ATP-binding protein [Actinomycetota bacterium]